MYTLEMITEAFVREVWKGATLQRGERLISRLRSRVRRGETLEAQVLDRKLYGVRLSISSSHLLASCACPQGRSGFCAHTAALALAWVRSPNQFSGTGTADQDANLLETIPADPPPTREPEEPPFWMGFSQDEFDALYRRAMADLLRGVSINDLRGMAEERGWKADGIRKDRVIQQVVEHLEDPDETRRSVEKLDAEHRQVLCGLVLLGYPRRQWDDSLEPLAALWGKLRSYKRIGTYERHLCEAGLALPAEALDDAPRDVVPRPLARLLPRLLSPELGLWPLSRGDGAVSEPGIDGPTPADVQLADPYGFIDKVLRVLMSLEETPTPMRTPQPRPAIETEIPGLAGWPYEPQELLQARRAGRLRRGYDLPLTIPPPPRLLPDEAVERLAPFAGDEEQLEFIVALLQAAQILQLGSPLTPWPPAREAFVRRDPMRQIGILAQTYFRMTNWSQLWTLLRDDTFRFRLRHDASSAYFGVDDLSSELAMLRWLLLRVFGSFPDDQWVSMEDLDRLLRILWPQFEHSAWDDFQLPSFDSYLHLAELDRDGELDYDEPGVWEGVQGRFVRGMITGPLHWLGLADVALEGRRLTHARFHGLADLYWHRAEAPQAPSYVSTLAAGSGEPDAVRTDGLVVTIRPSALGARAYGVLNAMARLETAGPDQFRYRLNGEACLEAFEGGRTLSDIVKSWGEHLPVPMPDPIREQLTEWWDGYGRLRLYKDVTVIEFGDDYALAEMKAVTSLDEHLIAEVSPRLVVIPETAIDGLVEELREAGHTPQTASGVELEEEVW